MVRWRCLAEPDVGATFILLLFVFAPLALGQSSSCASLNPKGPESQGLEALKTGAAHDQHCSVVKDACLDAGSVVVYDVSCRGGEYAP